MMFLSANELQELTGYIRLSAQIRWLTQNRWYYALDAAGRPRVALAEFNRQLVGTDGGHRKRAEPNFAAIGQRS